jgi:hypothetical protein
MYVEKFECVTHVLYIGAFITRDPVIYCDKINTWLTVRIERFSRLNMAVEIWTFEFIPVIYSPIVSQNG